MVVGAIKGCQTGTQESSTHKASLNHPYRNDWGTNESPPKSELFDVLCNGLSKPTDNVGQHAKNNGESKLSQFRWLGIRLVLYFYIVIDGLIEFLNFSSTQKIQKNG